MNEKMSVLKDLQIDFNVKNARELSTYKGGGDAIVVRPESVEKLCETDEVNVVYKRKDRIRNACKRLEYAYSRRLVRYGFY